MINSILNSTKKVLGLAESYTAFDEDVLMHINSAFFVLNQLGLGPDDGFMIVDDETTWDAFIGTDKRLNAVKTYIHLSVRLVYDPPATSYLINAMQDQKRELESRLNMYREGYAWVDPDPGPIDPDHDGILDGGDA